jgi:hypothetical protein
MRRSTLWWATLAAILLGAVVRIGVVGWTDPWETHHPDEHILPLEAMALWEGMTPREVGWPGSTTRLITSAVLGSQMLAEEGRGIWALRAQPDRALEIISTWTARRFVDPRPLYRTGRTLSVIAGILQLMAVTWALSRWVGPAGTLVGTLAVAISPVTVAYSQYVLADIEGLLFGTIAIGLAATPTPRRVLVMAALVGLAASSKFHFGLWLLTPLLCVWLGDRTVFPRKWLMSLGVVLTVAWVVVTLVPWFLMDPLLALKEFGGVVLVKVGHGSKLARMPRNLMIIFGGFGVVLSLGTLAGMRALDASHRRRFAPVVTPLLLASVALALMATVFDRYGLVLLPGAIIAAGFGWDSLLADPRVTVRRAGLAALTVCLVATTASLYRSQRTVGEVNVDVQLRNWIVANARSGAGVAVHDEMNAFLPRTLDQLRACADHVSTAAAYREKWRVEDIETAVSDIRPMESLLLTDERFTAHWCRRELGLANPAGFRVEPYHDAIRFGAVLESDAVNDFRNGRIDVLVMNREVEVGRAPAAIFSTRSGRRVIYQR